MVIKIHGLNEESREYSAAESLKRMFETDSELVHGENEIHLIPNVNCPSQIKSTIDIVILGKLKDYSKSIPCSVHRYDNENKLRKVRIKDFCVTIETKSHGINGIKLSNDDIAVKYGKDFKCVKEQSEGQKWALQNYLLHSKNLDIWSSYLISLPNINIRDLPEDYTICKFLLGKDSTVTDFFTKLFTQKKPVKDYNNEINYTMTRLPNKIDAIDSIITHFTRTLEPTRLDRKKMDAICKKIVDKDKQKYRDKMGKQLLLFKGRGGTGKTYRLLNLAHTMYIEESARCLILTFNHTLVSDIQRLFYLLKLRSGLEESIQIMTILSFWGKIFYTSGVREKENKDDIRDKRTFKKYKDKFMSNLKEGKINLYQLSEKHPSFFSWDYIFIDEGQDWSEDEKELIFKIFGYSNIVVADGIDQLIRSNKSLNWKPVSRKQESQIVSLTKSLRQKSNIVYFIKELNKKLDINDWYIEENEKSYGGKIVIIEGVYTKETHEMLAKENRNDKNKNLDMLFCIDPTLKKNNEMVHFFKTNNYLYWNGTDEDIRTTFPDDVNQFRIVQYDSSRGLEGWSVVNLNFDLFFEYKKKTYKDEVQRTFVSKEDKENYFASHWLLIPITRAMDTLVLQISSKETFIGKLLRKIYKESIEKDNPINMEWIESK